MFTAVTVTRPVLVVAPAARVSVVVALRVKSPDTAGDTAVAATVSVVASVVGCDSVAVTVDTSPFSRIDGGMSTRAAVAVASSSASVSVASAGAATPWPPVAVPETVTVLFAASTSLFTAATVTRPVLTVAPAAIVSSVPVCVKSPATAGDTAAVATVTVAATLDGPDSVAVTVAMPPFSEIEAGARARPATGNVSSSSSVSAAALTVPAPWPLASAAVTVALRFTPPWWMASSTAVTTTVSEAAVVAPAAMVMVASAPTV